MHDRFGQPRPPFSGPKFKDNTPSQWVSVNESFMSNTELEFAERDRVELLRMDNPVDLHYALGRFGLVLGGLPAAAIFYRLIFLLGGQNSRAVLVVAALMLLVGLFVGKQVGSGLADAVSAIERRGWPMMLAGSLAIGLLWGLATGGASGVLAFGIGAPIGAIIGAVVGAVAFPIFISLHRMLSRGGKIEASLLRPISFGIAAVIAGLILGL
ncbi:MAG: hypothetical protein QOH96_1022 [Blastocatellia bacterium]|nr:hypothetical protein [Blastocatellia bacterium]